jgi:hypothetical protein
VVDLLRGRAPSFRADKSMTADNEQSTADASKRWFVDSTGRTVYYPYGRGRSGYIINDPVRESALRDADRKFDEASKPFAPFAALLAVPALFALYNYAGSHPVLVFSILPATLMMFTGLDWLLRRPKLAPLLAELSRAPAADLNAQWTLRISGYLCLFLVVLIGFGSYLYDLRLAAVEVNATAIDFYPGISQYLLYGSFLALFFFVMVGQWNMVVASPKVGPKRALLSVFLFGLGAVGCFVAALWNFYNPKPTVVLAKDALYCNWRIRWADIANMGVRSGRKGGRYLRIEFAADRSPFSDRRSSESCEIDSLNVNYAEVYQAIYDKWQSSGAGSKKAGNSTPGLPDIAAGRHPA